MTDGKLSRRGCAWTGTFAYIDERDWAVVVYYSDRQEGSSVLEYPAFQPQSSLVTMHAEHGADRHTAHGVFLCNTRPQSTPSPWLTGDGSAPQVIVYIYLVIIYIYKRKGPARICDIHRLRVTPEYHPFWYKPKRDGSQLIWDRSLLTGWTSL